MAKIKKRSKTRQGLYGIYLPHIHYMRFSGCETTGEDILNNQKEFNGSPEQILNSPYNTPLTRNQRRLLKKMGYKSEDIEHD
ncbi:hypothetical protein PXH59_09880 [Xenorhabdus sp. SF857]|uniref:hypothetical protein n=1 Tax=Xenorhabdus bakwenae TaxID=3026967 RepID=UPI0025583117|nr:hypothetical protein [Xenorhabdus sp. SF857]WFQ81316.1 hypothetical protein PXH59_09880 [Xenorhabdus sp. SF857]